MSSVVYLCITYWLLSRCEETIISAYQKVLKKYIKITYPALTTAVEDWIEELFRHRILKVWFQLEKNQIT